MVVYASTHLLQSCAAFPVWDDAKMVVVRLRLDTLSFLKKTLLDSWYPLSTDDDDDDHNDTIPPCSDLTGPDYVIILDIFFMNFIYKFINGEEAKERERERKK